MYIGKHGLTEIELPDGQILYSRDLYVRVKLQSVIEIKGVGEFFVHATDIAYNRTESVAEEDKTEGVELEGPYCLMRLKVGEGDFTEVETEFHYLPGTAVRLDVEDALPEMRLTLGVPEWVQTHEREAASLRAEAEIVTAGRLHATARGQAIAATVFIAVEYADHFQTVSASGSGLFADHGIQSKPFSGSGFLINPHGYIVTNGHVVAPVLPADPEAGRPFPLPLVSVSVILFSGTDIEERVPATVVRYSEAPDLALLKIDCMGQDFLCLDGDDLTEMEPVLALGYPGGFDLALSGGHPEISFRAGQITAFRSEPQTKSFFVEHSAPMEQGNSGGPLATPRGTVVGVNTQLRGPQKQSRLALSRDTIFGFLFQETAEGKGPYYGPNAEERYTIFMARANVAWMYLDRDLFNVRTRGKPGRFGKDAMPREEALRIGTEALSSLGDLMSALASLIPAGPHYLSHAKVREGLRVQSEAMAKIVRLLADEVDDQFADENRRHGNVAGGRDKYREFDAASNEVQSGSTQLCFAFNRIIGQFWGMIEEIKQPPSPFQPTIWLPEYSPEIEGHVLAELGNIFQRHRGHRVAIIHFKMEDEGGAWERIIVYRHALISGSEAMLREIARLRQENGWETSAERLAGRTPNPTEAE